MIGKLGRWAARSPLHDPTLPLSHAAIMMSLQTMIDPEKAQGLSGRFGFIFGAVSYSGILKDSEFTPERGPVDGCDVLFDTTPEGLAAIIYGGAPLETVKVVGDRELTERFVRLFPLPEKIASS